MKLATQLHLVTKLRMRAAILELPSLLSCRAIYFNSETFFYQAVFIII